MAGHLPSYYHSTIATLCNIFLSRFHQKFKFSLFAQKICFFARNFHATLPCFERIFSIRIPVSSLRISLFLTISRTSIRFSLLLRPFSSVFAIQKESTCSCSLLYAVRFSAVLPHGSSAIFCFFRCAFVHMQLLHAEPCVQRIRVQQKRLPLCGSLFTLRFRF